MTGDEMEAFEPDYLVTLDEIYHAHWAAGKRWRIALLREAVDHFWPEGHPARLIHITGTNGKGSTAHYLARGLEFAGNTGSWTGPHVFDYAERFHVNGAKAAHADIVRIYREVLAPYQQAFMREHGGLSLSFAELGILMALKLFEKYEVAWGVMEVGAGGRYTPLMALDAAACVLTNVADDHPKSLGARLWQRALVKAGIARAGVPFFTAASGAALHFVREAVRAEGAEATVVTREDLREVHHHLSRSVPGFTARNLALAGKLIRHFHPEREPSELFAGMCSRLPARFWQPAPNVVADIAHNRGKIAALARELCATFPDTRFRFVFGLTRERDARTIFAPLTALAASIVVTSASYAGRDPRELAERLRPDFPDVEVIADPLRAYRTQLRRLLEGEVLVLTGSAYMIDQALNPNPYLKQTNASYGWRTAEKDG